MRTNKFDDDKIIGILRQVEGGQTIAEVCRQHRISTTTYYRWKAQFGGLDESHARRLRQLEDQNRQLEDENRQLEDQNRQLEDENRQLEDQNRQLEDQNRQLEDENRQLEDQNRRLRQIVADLTLENRALKEAAKSAR